MLALSDATCKEAAEKGNGARENAMVVLVTCGSLAEAAARLHVSWYQEQASRLLV